MSVKTKLDTPQSINSVANKSLSEEERIFKDQKAQDRLRHLIKTRNNLWAILRFK